MITANEQAFGNILASYVVGTIRLASARTFALTASDAVAMLKNVNDQGEIVGSVARILNRLNDLSYDEYSSFNYISDMSTLIYATTLFDTFVSDTTHFLLLLHPELTAENEKTTNEVSALAQSEIVRLNTAAADKARKVGRRNFPNRIKYLIRTFGLNISLPLETWQALEYYRDTRNVIVHDQSILIIELDESGVSTSRPKPSSRASDPISDMDLRTALLAYNDVAIQFSLLIANRVLNSPTDSKLRVLISSLSESQNRMRL